MKILYVEDELKKNISGIIQLFEKYLGEDIVLKLEELMNDAYSGDEEIKGVIEQCDFIDVAYKFPEAIRIVKGKTNEYTLFIVDCNLSEQPYTIEELKEVAPEYDKDKQERYNQREGEFLLNILSAKKELVEEIKEKFYFLSAYSKSHNIMGLIDNETIYNTNYVEKGNDTAKKILINKINNSNLSKLIQYKRQIKILSKYCWKDKNHFLEVIYNMETLETKQIGDNLKDIRIVLDGIMTSLAYKIKASKEYFVKGNLKFRPFVRNYLIQFDKKKDLKTYNFMTNSIIENEINSIYTICSDYGNHSVKTEGFSITNDTLKFLIYALKDIILWFGQVMENKK